MSDILVNALQHREELLRDLEKIEGLLARAERLADRQQANQAPTEEEPLVLVAQPESSAVYMDSPAEAAALTAVRRWYKSEERELQNERRTILQRMVDHIDRENGMTRRSVFRGALVHRLDTELAAA